MADLPAIIRPNGKTYRPRKVIVEPWEIDGAAYGWESGVIVFGTHDVEVAQPLADVVCKGFDPDYVAVGAKPIWYRDGYENGERVWMDDEVRGRAGVWFRADYPPAVPASPAGGGE